MNKRLWEEYSDYLDDNEWISYVDWLEMQVGFWQYSAWFLAMVFAAGLFVVAAML